MKRAFLSYALEDATQKNLLVLAMSELEIDDLMMIWQDLHGTPGGRFAEQIAHQIDRADIFIARIPEVRLLRESRAQASWHSRKGVRMPDCSGTAKTGYRLG